MLTFKLEINFFFITNEFYSFFPLFSFIVWKRNQSMLLGRPPKCWFPIKRTLVKGIIFKLTHSICCDHFAGATVAVQQQKPIRFITLATAKQREEKVLKHKLLLCTFFMNDDANAIQFREISFSFHVSRLLLAACHHANDGLCTNCDPSAWAIRGSPRTDCVAVQCVQLVCLVFVSSGMCPC